MQVLSHLFYAILHNRSWSRHCYYPHFLYEKVKRWYLPVVPQPVIGTDSLNPGNLTVYALKVWAKNAVKLDWLESTSCSSPPPSGQLMFLLIVQSSSQAVKCSRSLNASLLYLSLCKNAVSFSNINITFSYLKKSYKWINATC